MKITIVTGIVIMTITITMIIIITIVITRIIEVISPLAESHPTHPLATPASKISQIASTPTSTISVSHHISSVAEAF